MGALIITDPDDVPQMQAAFGIISTAQPAFKETLPGAGLGSASAGSGALPFFPCDYAQTLTENTGFKLTDAGFSMYLRALAEGSR